MSDPNSNGSKAAPSDKTQVIGGAVRALVGPAVVPAPAPAPVTSSGGS
ncbi:MAG TPA: hypothetical protein PKA98_13520 [Acidimicrobiales bacterium]|nr:hypothetical protein [Acidimicrobiales bacterium]